MTEITEAQQVVNILLVEDDRVDVMAFYRAMKEQKVSNPVFVAGDGIEAFELLRGEKGQTRLLRPYLILLDLNMPRMNGLQFLERLREDPELSSSIVFVLTTSDNEKDKIAAYASHIAGYLLKTEIGDHFISAIRLIDRFVLTGQFPAE